jgi:hypothetical protein
MLKFKTQYGFHELFLNFTGIWHAIVLFFVVYFTALRHAVEFFFLVYFTGIWHPVVHVI